jgi:hypothetical protein
MEILADKEKKMKDLKQEPQNSPKRVIELSTESAMTVKGGKTCNCSCQTENEKAATTLKTFTA